MNLLSMSKEQLLTMLIARVIIILLILPLHEFAHAWVARLCGDDTADSKGRLTLNPFSHVDPFGAILLLLTGFGWAKPVPINPNRMRNPRTGVIWTSLAGPASNLLIAFVMMIPFRILESIPISSEAMYNTLSIIYSILYFFILVNIGLAVFNLIPIPPLDGSKILAAFLPDRVLYKFYRYQNVFMMVLMLLLFSGILDYPLSIFNSAVQMGVMWLASLPFRLFGLF